MSKLSGETKGDKIFWGVIIITYIVAIFGIIVMIDDDRTGKICNRGFFKKECLENYKLEQQQQLQNNNTNDTHYNNNRQDRLYRYAVTGSHYPNSHHGH
jgi:hypothetical protein